MSQSLTVQCAHKTYPIFIKNNLLNTLDSTIDSREKKIALVTDETVYDLYGKELINKLATISQKVFPVVVKPGEESKSLETLAQVYNQLIDKGITKSDLIIALGGGVIGDLAGFAASTYLREVPYIQIPTTLLAQVDSSVGGKTAVNLPQGKNLIGSFYHPDAVFIDPLVLNTLPPRTFSDGLAEVIKYSMIQDAELFNLLAGHDSSSILPYMEDIITRCLDIKRRIVQEDERDNGIRMILNFGHTLGHAVEKVFNFGTYTHGEGVAIGMYQITQKSEEMNLTVKGVSEKLRQVLMQYNLPYQMPEASMEDFLQAMETDKKSRGQSIHLILIRDIGECFVHTISKADMKLFLKGGPS